MKKIAISQRIDAVPDRDECRDGLDVRIGALVWSLGFLPIPLASSVPDKAGYLQALHADGFILSGGNDVGDAPDRDELEYAILDYAEARRRPVFGICRGLQVINLRQGGRLEAVGGHVAVDHPVMNQALGGDRVVNSFHDYVIPEGGLGAELECLARAPDNTIEAARHVRLPWLAVMWHPERDIPVDTGDSELMRRHLEGES